jgi:regulator of cell morphogenesis and NO signaling
MIHQNQYRFITSGMKMADIINENPNLMLLFEHFGIELVVHDKSVSQICKETPIRENVFLSFANLFNGYSPSSTDQFQIDDIETILVYLKNSHHYYREEIFPKIRKNIRKMHEYNNLTETAMVGKFFDDYYQEVSEHLDYEDRTVFPYVKLLLGKVNNVKTEIGSVAYSVTEYRDHHDDIEEKLNDLKNLLIKHLPQKDDQRIRRKLLFSLFELEHDLNIHSKIEDTILVPLVEKMEQAVNKRS